jgi:hypothetical protein
MHLPTINHIDLSYIRNLPLSILSLSVNLHRLDLFCLECFDYFDQHGENGSFEIVHSKTTPKIREFYTSGSGLPTTELLHAKRQDGLPSFNFVELSMSFIEFKDERSIRYLLENAKLLEKLHLTAGRYQTLLGLISPCARTLKVLDLTVFLNQTDVPPLAGICKELEAIAGQNMLEALSFEIQVDRVEREDFMGTIIQEVEKVLVKPGWSALRQVSFKFLILSSSWNVSRWDSEAIYGALESLPDKYLSHLSKLESVTFNYTISVI